MLSTVPNGRKPLKQPPGTILEFAKVELVGSTERYFLHSVEDKNAAIPFGYVDDGAPHQGDIIHTCRIPEPAGAPRFAAERGTRTSLLKDQSTTVVLCQQPS